MFLFGPEAASTLGEALTKELNGYLTSREFASCYSALLQNTLAASYERVLQQDLDQRLAISLLKSVIEHIEREEAKEYKRIPTIKLIAMKAKRRVRTMHNKTGFALAQLIASDFSLALSASPPFDRLSTAEKEMIFEGAALDAVLKMWALPNADQAGIEVRCQPHFLKILSTVKSLTEDRTALFIQRASAVTFGTGAATLVGLSIFGHVSGVPIDLGLATSALAAGAIGANAKTSANVSKRWTVNDHLKAEILGVADRAELIVNDVSLLASLVIGEENFEFFIPNVDPIDHRELASLLAQLRLSMQFLLQADGANFPAMRRLEMEHCRQIIGLIRIGLCDPPT